VPPIFGGKVPKLVQTERNTKKNWFFFISEVQPIVGGEVPKLRLTELKTGYISIFPNAGNAIWECEKRPFCISLFIRRLVRDGKWANKVNKIVEQS